MFKVEWFSEGKVMAESFEDEWDAREFARELYREFLIPSDVVKT